MLVLTSEDIKKAMRLYEKEKLKKFDLQNMFLAGIYSILSAAENSGKHGKLYGRLLDSKLDSHSKIIQNKQEVKKIIREARYPNLKYERILKFAEWWSSSDLPEKIQYDVYNGREKEVELRNELAREAPGMSLKCSSLFMNKLGYENVIPIDVWLLRLLDSLGYKVELPDYKTQSGPVGKKYLEYERIIQDMAKEYEIPPVIFQIATWKKYSTLGRKRKLSSLSKGQKTLTEY